MQSRFASSSFIGYVELQCSSSNGQFAWLKSSTTSSISSSVDMPVEMKVRFLSYAICSSKGLCPSMGEATLLNGTSKLRMKYWLLRSHADADHAIPSSLQ